MNNIFELNEFDLKNKSEILKINNDLFFKLGFSIDTILKSVLLNKSFHLVSGSLLKKALL